MTTGTPLGRFTSSASLWPPRLISPLSAWNEHVPFAGWVIEALRPGTFVELGTHAGVSYFAFCEAVARHELGTRCFAVDTWVGDEHAGEYGEDVYENVRELNERYYEGFSTLLRNTFDEAVHEFEDGSVDLLHIDGYHTYDAVKHDFETWLPKLSGRGVVLLHDTNERKEDFGVYRFMAELADRYPTFEFTHGHGLGVIFVGSEVPESVAALGVMDDSVQILEIRDLYAALGRRLSAEVQGSVFKDERDQARQDLRASGSELRWNIEALDKTRGELTDARRDLQESTKGLAAIRKQLDDAKAKAAADSHARRETITQITDRLAEAQRVIGERNVTLGQRGEKIQSLKFEVVDRDRQIVLHDAMYRELASRRSVRFALGLAGLTKPVFNAVRGRGRRDDDAGLDASGSAASGISRQYETYDQELENQTKSDLHRYSEKHPELASTLVSIVLPTFNREKQLAEAVDSVIAQSHENWELLIVDDGSTDNTADLLDEYGKDNRIRPMRQEQSGVSVARNAALDVAQGELIAFLDSDNTWEPEYLGLMVAGLDKTGATIAYSGMKLESTDGIVGFRGDHFDYNECLEANYVDVNVLVHTRESVDDGSRFDASLRRMNDWDYLLRISRDVDVAYLPFIGATYRFEDSGDQISVREPFLYKKVIQQRHAAVQDDDVADIDARTIFKRTPFRVAVRIAAPSENRNEWGDYHFAMGLKQAFERRGHECNIAFRDDNLAGHYDIVISLRGLVKHDPVPFSLNILWSISHPDLLTVEELNEFDLVFSASPTWPKSLAWAREAPNHILLQATDRARFYPHSVDSEHDREVLFVGNSRGEDRWIVNATAEAGFPLAIFGNGWSGRIDETYIRGTYLPNESLGQHYARATIVLNDHWPSMRQFGYVSNRVFDVTASGGNLVSDTVPSLELVFGDGVRTVDSVEELASAIDSEIDAAPERSLLAPWVVDNHSFDNRAESVMLHIEDFLFTPTALRPRHLGAELLCHLCDLSFEAPGRVGSSNSGDLAAQQGGIPVLGTVRHLAIGLIPQPAGDAFTSSAYIRLIQPLTAEIEGFDVDLRLLDLSGDSAAGLRGLDVVIVSRVGVADPAVAKSLVANLQDLGIPLIVDLDDAFHEMDSSHPEYTTYAPLNEALSTLLDAAAEVWVSTDPLAVSLASVTRDAVHVIQNSLDPRLWKSYRSEDDELRGRTGSQLEILYAGTRTHAADLESVLPALDDLAADVDFTLSIIGVGAELPERPWIRDLSPGANSLYPRYARWLRGLRSGFDVGIAPLVDSSFNQYKSDVKIMEYLALGLIPLASDIGPYEMSDLLDSSMRIASISGWKEELSNLAMNSSYRNEQSGAAERLTTSLWESRTAPSVGAQLVARIEGLIDDLS